MAELLASPRRRLAAWLHPAEPSALPPCALPVLAAPPQPPTPLWLAPSSPASQARRLPLLRQSSAVAAPGQVWGASAPSPSPDSQSGAGPAGALWGWQGGVRRVGGEG